MELIGNFKGNNHSIYSIVIIIKYIMPYWENTLNIENFINLYIMSVI